MCKVLSKILHIAAPIAGGLLLGPAGFGLTSALAGGAIGGGLDALASGKGIKGALETGGLDYLGGSIGNSLFPETVGSAIGSTASNAVKSGLGSSIGGALTGTSIGSALGGYAGNSIANGLTAKAQPSTNVNPTSLLPAAFKPTNQAQIQVPGSLDNSQFSSLTPDQKTSNLATQGVYGGGNGPQEQQYFTQLVNNQLVDPSGKVSPTSSLSPIENSYLSQLGFGGYSNSNDLLGAISKWQKQNPQQATA